MASFLTPNQPTPEQLRNRAVALNTGNEAVAGTADMFLNAPVNAWNLAKAGYGTAMGATGRPDQMPGLSQPPNYARRALQAGGFIRPEWAPKDEGEGYLGAAAGGAVAGAPGGPAGMALGAGANLLAQAVANRTGNPNWGMVAGIAAYPAANAAARYGNRQLALADQLKSQKEPILDTMREVREAGYVMPPSQTNPTIANRLLESIAGKIATAQDFSMANQGVTDKIVRRGIGAPADMGITEAALTDLAHQRAQPYRDVAALPGLPAQQRGVFITPSGSTPLMGPTPKTPAAMSEELRTTRLEAKLQWNAFKRNGDPEAFHKYEAAQAHAAALEQGLEQAAIAAGKPSLVQSLREARTDIAKIHDVDRALNTDRGEVSAVDLARARERGVPLSGELLTASKMGNAYPKAVQRPEVIGSPGVNNLTTMLGSGFGAALGGVGGSAAGPAGIATGAGIGGAIGAVAPTAASLLARRLIMSKPYQNMMGTPTLDAGVVSKVASQMPLTPAEAQAYRAYLLSQQLQGAQQ